MDAVIRLSGNNTVCLKLPPHKRGKKSVVWGRTALGWRWFYLTSSITSEVATLASLLNLFLSTSYPRAPPQAWYSDDVKNVNFYSYVVTEKTHSRELSKMSRTAGENHSSFNSSPTNTLPYVLTVPQSTTSKNEELHMHMCTHTQITKKVSFIVTILCCFPNTKVLSSIHDTNV